MKSAKLRPELIPCSRCAGTGHVEFTGEIADTLAALRKAGDEVTGAEFGRQLGIRPTAMNQRLVTLEQLGSAQSRVYGRKRLYKATA